MNNLKSHWVTQALVLLGLVGITGSATAQNWNTQSNMKVARVEATTVDYRNDIYVFNGFKPGIKIANSVEKYDSATKQWSIIAGTSTLNDSAVTHNGVVRVGADVWIIGGRVGNHPGRVTDNVWIFNLNNNKWRRGPNLPTPVAAGGAALVNNKIHWIGGIDTNAACDVNTHFVYNLDSPAAGWKNITASAGMPSPRNHFSTAVVDGIIYTMGGQYGHDGCPGKNTDDTPLVHAFNPKNNSWSRKADMPNKNSHSEPGTFVYKGDIYTTGGENALDQVWKYNPRSNNWSKFRTLPERLVAPIARIIDGRLIVAGGGAPIARNSVDTVRSILVDNNPPATQPNPPQQPAPTPAPPPEPVPGSNTPAGPTLISMEAEYFDVETKTSTHQWVHVARSNTSNDDAMITTPDEGQLAGSVENTPMLSYMVYFNHPGKHYIWIRGAGDSNASGVGNSDSIHVGLNGTIASTASRIDQFPAEWTWSRHTPSDPVASLNVVNAGVNMINFWMREDGLAIDKFVITSDPSFVPEGYGPEVTDGTSNYIPPVTNVAEPDTNEPINDEPAVTEPTANEPIEAETNNSDVEATDSTTDFVEVAPVNNDTGVVEPVVVTDTTQVEAQSPSGEQAVAGESVVTNAKSNNRLFGGSASTSGVLALFVLCFVRVVRRSV